MKGKLFIFTKTEREVLISRQCLRISVKLFVRCICWWYIYNCLLLVVEKSVVECWLLTVGCLCYMVFDVVGSWLSGVSCRLLVAAYAYLILLLVPSSAKYVSYREADGRLSPWITLGIIGKCLFYIIFPVQLPLVFYNHKITTVPFSYSK